MRQRGSWSKARAVRAAVAALTAALLASTFPAGAASEAQQSFRDAIRRRPVFNQPKPLPAAYRMSRERLAAVRDAVFRQLDYVPGEVIVKFRDGVSTEGQARALGVLRSRPSVGSLRWIGDAAVLQDLTQPDAVQMARQLADQPEVEYAHPNHFLRLGPASLDLSSPVEVTRTPTDPSYAGKQWNYPAVGFPAAWDINDGADPNVTIAIVDSGLTTQSYSLTADIWTGSDFEELTLPFGPNPDMSPSRIVSPFDFALFAAGGPVLDLDGHGSHVAGTAGQQSNNGIGLAGAAYNARIMPVKVCLGYWDLMILQGAFGDPGFLPPDISVCTFSDVAAGIRYAADSGADVINFSLGGPSPAPVLRDAIQYAVSTGAFVSISMGNEFDSGNTTSYPAAYAASIDGAMAVAAVGRSLTRAFYSNTGAHAEIAAPGGSSLDGGFDGLVHQVTLGSPSSPLLLVPVFDRWFEVGFQGTSMASPHVAGAAALVVSQMPGVTPAQIETILRMTARPCSTTSCSVGVGMQGSRTNEFGYGLVQPRAALFGRGIAR